MRHHRRHGYRVRMHSPLPVSRCSSGVAGLFSPISWGFPFMCFTSLKEGLTAEQRLHLYDNKDTKEF
ncbi:unnamed protein product [Boreogadus saida]